MKKPKGIILIESDQHRYDCMGHTGHPLLKTPNLDRLAAEGMSFSNALPYANLLFLLLTATSSDSAHSEWLEPTDGNMFGMLLLKTNSTT